MAVASHKTEILFQLNFVTKILLTGGMFISDQGMYNNRVINHYMFNLYTYSVASASSCPVHPSEYAYHRDFVIGTERDSVTCKNYPRTPQLGSENYIHCKGTPLRLTDSDIGSDQHTTSDYYLWPAGSGSQLLFIFPTIVNLTTITLHYYSSSIRALPRLRFWTVPDDFDVWDAPVPSYSHVDVAAVPPGEEPAGHRNVSIKYYHYTSKLLLVKYSSSYTFQVNELEFLCYNCNGKNCINNQLKVLIILTAISS